MKCKHCDREITLSPPSVSVTGHRYFDNRISRPFYCQDEHPVGQNFQWHEPETEVDIINRLLDEYGM